MSSSQPLPSPTRQRFFNTPNAAIQPQAGSSISTFSVNPRKQTALKTPPPRSSPSCAPTPRHHKRPKKPVEQPVKTRPGIKNKLSDNLTLGSLGQRMRQKLHLSFDPDPWQVQTVSKVLLGYDALVLAGTGYGKSLVFESVAVLSGKAKLTIIISPLKALELDQVKKASEKGIRAVAINEDTERTATLWRNLRTSTTMAYLSPEMAKSDSFYKLWRDAKFRSRLACVVVDEAHCTEDYGEDNYRPQYRELDTLRAYTGLEVPFLACTATCPTKTFETIWKTLGFGNRPFWGINVGSDRENLYYAVCATQHMKQPQREVAKLLPSSPTHARDIPKMLIYLDSRNGCSTLLRALKKILPPRLRSCIQSFHSRLSDEAKQEIWEHFSDGRVRILIATDAAGMGCNVSDVEYCIIFGTPRTISSISQRWGRAGRNRTLRGFCLLLVPPWAFRPATKPAAAALSRVRGKAVVAERKTWTSNRAKLDSDVEAFINAGSGDSGCLHRFLRDNFKPSTGLSIYTELTSELIATSGLRSERSPFQLGWVEMSDLQKIPPKDRCCSNCNPEIMEQYNTQCAGDAQSFASQPSSPALSHASTQSAASVAASYASQSKRTAPNLNRQVRDDLQERLEKFTDDLFKKGGNSRHISRESLFSPRLIKAIDKLAPRLCKLEEITPDTIKSAGVKWNLGSPKDWLDLSKVISDWVEFVFATLRPDRTTVPPQPTATATPRTPPSQKRPSKKARTRASQNRAPFPQPNLLQSTSQVAAYSTPSSRKQTRKKIQPNPYPNSTPVPYPTSMSNSFPTPTPVRQPNISHIYYSTPRPHHDMPARAINPQAPHHDGVSMQMGSLGQPYPPLRSLVQHPMPTTPASRPRSSFNPYTTSLTQPLTPRYITLTGQQSVSSPHTTPRRAPPAPSGSQPLQISHTPHPHYFPNDGQSMSSTPHRTYPLPPQAQIPNDYPQQFFYGQPYPNMQKQQPPFS